MTNNFKHAAVAIAAIGVAGCSVFSDKPVSIDELKQSGDKEAICAAEMLGQQGAVKIVSIAGHLLIESTAPDGTIRAITVYGKPLGSRSVEFRADKGNAFYDVGGSFRIPEEGGLKANSGSKNDANVPILKSSVYLMRKQYYQKCL